MSVTVNESQDKTEVTINVRGRFDFSCHQDFMRAYKAYPKGDKRFVVDLKDTEYMDSSAMGMLLQIREYSAQNGVLLQNGNDSVKEILRIANFDKLFTIT
ncbi:MAG: anti-sigma factor antagonist [Sedimenticola sp.]|jgi:anti-anti-sigma factor|nr:MAG: anti-sigma factor antagonist [Sedimenticola sp.]